MVKKIFVIPPDQIDTTRHPGYPEGDNRSRNAFTWNLASKKGKIFQGIIKPAIIKMIGVAHTLIRKSYGKNAFVYDDPRLQYLHNNLHESIRTDFDHQQRKLDFMNDAIDIGLFMLSGRSKTVLNVLKPVMTKTIGKMHSWILKSWDADAFIYDDPRLQHLHENLHNCIGHDAEMFMNDAIDIGLFISKEDIYYRARLFRALNKINHLEITEEEINNVEMCIECQNTTNIRTLIFYMLNQLPAFELTPAEIVNIETCTKGFGTITYAEREVLENAAKDRIENKEIVG